MSSKGKRTWTASVCCPYCKIECDRKRQKSRPSEKCESDQQYWNLFVGRKGEGTGQDRGPNRRNTFRRRSVARSNKGTDIQSSVGEEQSSRERRE